MFRTVMDNNGSTETSEKMEHIFSDIGDDDNNNRKAYYSN